LLKSLTTLVLISTQISSVYFIVLSFIAVLFLLNFNLENGNKNDQRILKQ